MSDNKKLDIPGGYRDLLVKALTEAANDTGVYMRRIYDDTIEQISSQPAQADRIYLTQAQQNIIQTALYVYERRHGAFAWIERMRLQLVMTRKNYDNLVRNHNTDFIRDGATVYYVHPESEDMPVRTGIIDAVYEDGSAEISDKYLGDVDSNVYRIFASKAEAHLYWSYLSNA